MSFNAACRRLCAAKVYPHRYRGAPSRGRSQRYVLASPCSHSERQRRISVHAVYESFVIKYQSAGKSRCMQIRKQSASGCGLSPTCTFRTINKNNIPMIGTPERWDEGSALFLPLFHGSRASGNGWNKARTFRSLYSYSNLHGTKSYRLSPYQSMSCLSLCTSFFASSASLLKSSTMLVTVSKFCRSISFSIWSSRIWPFSLMISRLARPS